ncbi:MAG: hypothetical protein AABY64_02465 [Bdellovibrionota bacterium]
MKKNLLLVAILFCSFLSERSIAQTCQAAFELPEHIRISLSSTDIKANRQKITSYAKTHGLPLFEVILNGQPVPVVLLNKKTLLPWNWLLVETMGIAHSMNPGNKANHGYVRLPGKASYDGLFETPNALFFGKEASSAMMDLFSPGQAGPNAAADTGYRFKSLADYFAKRTADSTEFVDLAFNLSREDQARVWLYQAAKRIALVRIQYAFDTPQNDWIVQQRRVLQKDGEPYTDLLKGGFEHCNNSRCGQVADIHVREMRTRLFPFLNKDANQVFNTHEAKRFLDDAKKDLLSRDWRHRSTYNPDFLNTDHYLGLMKYHLKEGLSREQQVDAISYLLAINIFEEMIQIKNKLSLSESRAAQYDNPNISAILIYSDKSDMPGKFYQGQVNLDTAPLAEGNNGFRSDYFQVIRTFTDLLLNQKNSERYRP